MLFQDLKEYISKAGEVTFADAHKRRQGEGLVSEYIHTYVQKTIQVVPMRNAVRVMEKLQNFNFPQIVLADSRKV